jgi:hypothetical protein
VLYFLPMLPDLLHVLPGADCQLLSCFFKIGIWLPLMPNLQSGAKVKYLYAVPATPMSQNDHKVTILYS